jgi:predicted glycosyltransferase
MGLGHLRRNTLIGQQLLEVTQDSNILLIADSPVAPFFKLPEGMDFVKLPSIRKIGPGQWEPTHLRISDADIRGLRADLLHNVIQSFRPDLVLVDHMPVGARRELVPALELLKHACPECSVVLGLRDILDAQEVITNVWQKEGAYDALQRYYDSVLIYGNSQIFDTSRTYSLPVPPRGIHYCGYVVNSGPVQPASKIRQSLGVQDKILVFVSAGGGADGHPLMRTYLRAIRRLGCQANFTTLMAVGVNVPPDICRELEAEALGLPVWIVSHVEDSLSHMASADLVVCMAGYNTLSEVLYLRKKALVVPRGGPSAEQRMRAGLFASRGLIEMLDPRDLSPETLAQRLSVALQRDDYPIHDEALDMSGARKAAGRLLELLR